MTDQLIGLGGAALFLAYHFAFGFGLQRNERQWAIQVYSVGSMLLLAEVRTHSSPQWMGLSITGRAACN
jgi:hypothetical protein